MVNYAAACRSANCPRLSFNVIHQLLHIDWTVWGYLKDQVHQDGPATVEELINNIERETWAIGTATCCRVIDKFARHIMACIRRNGGNLDNILDAHN